MSLATVVKGANKETRDLIAFALNAGWQAVRTNSGHVKFLKPGCEPVFTSFTASDFRSSRNARAQLRRADRESIGHVGGKR